MNPTKPTAVIADDHRLVLEGMIRLLEPYCDIVATATDGNQLLAAVEQHQPELVITDIGMPGLNGLSAVRMVKGISPKTKCLIVTQYADAHYVRAAIAAGATGYLVKQSAASELSFAIEVVRQGAVYISAETGVSASSQMSGANQSGLTQRQREVLQLVADGKSNKEIASILNISPKTVEFHKTQLMNLLGIRTTAGLTKYAIAEGITESPNVAHA